MLVSLISRLVACSPRIVVDKQTNRQTHRTTTVTLAAHARRGLTTNKLSPLQGTISVISHLPHSVHVHAPNTEFCCTNYHKLHCQHNISLFRGKQLTCVENGHRQHCTKYTVHTPAEGSASSIIDSATSVSPISSNSQIILFQFLSCVTWLTK